MATLSAPVAIFVILTLAGACLLFARKKTRTDPPPAVRYLSDADIVEAKKAKEMAAKAALKRQENDMRKQYERKKVFKESQKAKHQTMSRNPMNQRKKDHLLPYVDSVTTALPGFDYQGTSYRHMAHLPNADAAANMLKRIAQEFAPIIRERGYHVLSVSEMCCCGDGMDYELGGLGSSVRPGSKIEEVDVATGVGGYNQTKHRSYGQTTHVIHLHLRHPTTHSVLRDYEEVVHAMAHELAHCVHHHHESSFFQLMDELIHQHSMVVQKQLLGTNDRSVWALPQNQFGEFNVCEPTASRYRY